MQHALLVELGDFDILENFSDFCVSIAVVTEALELGLLYFARARRFTWLFAAGAYVSIIGMYILCGRKQSSNMTRQISDSVLQCFSLDIDKSIADLSRCNQLKISKFTPRPSLIIPSGEFLSHASPTYLIHQPLLVSGFQATQPLRLCSIKSCAALYQGRIAREQNS